MPSGSDGATSSVVFGNGVIESPQPLLIMPLGSAAGARLSGDRVPASAPASSIPSVAHSQALNSEETRAEAADVRWSTKSAQSLDTEIRRLLPDCCHERVVSRGGVTP
jgi:hypothetical protein